MEKLTVFIVLILALIDISQGLRCYNCTHAQKECLADSFDSSKIKFEDCRGLSLAAAQGSGPTCLLKIVKDKQTGVTATYRRCLPVANPDACRILNENQEIISCRTCDYDACNASSGITSTTLFLIIPLWSIFAKIIFT